MPKTARRSMVATIVTAVLLTLTGYAATTAAADLTANNVRCNSCGGGY